jgi:hypothetical protein
LLTGTGCKQSRKQEYKRDTPDRCYGFSPHGLSPYVGGCGLIVCICFHLSLLTKPVINKTDIDVLKIVTK